MSNGLSNGTQIGERSNLINTPWIDFSEQSTIVGWSSFTTKQIRYKVVGKLVHVVVLLIGTSNNAATTITLPFLPMIGTSNTLYSTDNGSPNICTCFLSVNQITAVFWRWSAITTLTQTWTASGAKNIQGEFFYEIA